MTERPADLPDYHAPPVDEVSIQVQFAPISKFHDAHAGAFWQRVQEDYPKSESQPRLEGPIESSESGPIVPIQLQFTAGQGRVWLISADDESIVQIQNTRFIQNWRRRTSTYHHFEQVRDPFWKNFRKFLDFLDQQGLERPIVQQVEVTYTNWISDMPMSDFLRPGSVAEVSAPGVNSYPDQQSWIARYSLQNDKDLIQRLYVQSLPAFRYDAPDSPGSQFALVCRAARPSGISETEAAELIDAARATIVTAFTDLTTDEAHARWGRFQ